MTLLVRSPVAGTVVPVADVPDPVFAEGMVGPGTAVEPGASGHRVLAPLDGRLVKLHPHACVVQAAGGQAVLVHLGIDTVRLGGEGFTLHVGEGDLVRAGDLLVEWDPAAVRAGGLSAVCPVVLLEAPVEDVRLTALPGTEVSAGDPLLELGDR
ncbi:PTS system N-acetylglucosamine-specific IIA component (Glc family) [Isoptericola sp. CG 20/1183]|uniref:PTS system N-acetylglucosamine-specific IIA component (Glc family) n=1 Tax=Isoptericola halotolerans TaxID=300560 RepID=A0ABX5EI04_9MICO|nr:MULTISPECIES: PTS glucose transporter subunit IIA [Isoptericola]MCK0118198.1 PTS glucose transporter subunit IIA [Isoptericola sp. S6320L]PRZ09317.1 PTS system N-acetylglucosamine-specific IIA component (Glc family) [Isoptericola sp. CG 20/1183]PRZ10118.1 PTS system N-acetylglucosamine-specific IIA component (Glc family) [Isoptericola halotolerans]